MADLLRNFETSSILDRSPSRFEEDERRPDSGVFRIGAHLEEQLRRPRSVLGEADSDETLVLEARSGNESAATQIWIRYSGLVRAMLRRSVGSDEVDDAVQEVFIRLFPALPQLRQAASLRSFLIGITLRVAGTGLRRRRCREWLQLTPTGELSELATAVSDDVEAHEALVRFYGILDKLGQKPRLVFVLRYVEGMDLTEVAAALEISLATAKRYLARAAARVSSMVERDPALASYVTNGSRFGDRNSRAPEDTPTAQEGPRVAREACA